MMLEESHDAVATENDAFRPGDVSAPARRGPLARAVVAMVGLMALPLLFVAFARDSPSPVATTTPDVTPAVYAPQDTVELADAPATVQEAAASNALVTVETCPSNKPADASNCAAGGDPICAPAAAVPPQCASKVDAVVSLGQCSTAQDSDVWNELIGCAFRPNNWMHWRYGGEGGCSGPTLFRFCQDAFADVEDEEERKTLIQCCSASRCPWSASTFGHGGGQPICVNEEWAVNICCLPCTCWLSTTDVDGDGGNAGMTIDEDYTDDTGLSYPVLKDALGQPIAAPFPCDDAKGLFGRTDVLTVAEWQEAMNGGCSWDPMGGRRLTTGLRPSQEQQETFQPAWWDEI